MAGAAPTRDEAWELFCEWTESDSLRKHVLGVEAAMVAYAARVRRGRGALGVTGILHDLDYERYPDLEHRPPAHGARAASSERGYPDELIDAVAGHADFLGVPRETQMAKTLYAVDELSGFVAACALVRPTGIEGMTPKSVKKKLKHAELRRRREPRRGAPRRRGARRGLRRARCVRDRGDGGAGRRARPARRRPPSAQRPPAWPRRPGARRSRSRPGCGARRGGARG